MARRGDAPCASGRHPERAWLFARWRRQERLRPPRSRSPVTNAPLVPGLRIVWTPGIVVSALRCHLKRLGLDTPEVRQQALARLRIRLRPGTRGTYETPCPGCGKRCVRLWWQWSGFLGGACCVDFAQHGPRCHGGRWKCRRHCVPRLERYAAEYLLACRLGAANCSRYRLRLTRAAARGIPGADTLVRASVMARIGQALAVPYPTDRARGASQRSGPGPVASALGLAFVRLLIDHVYAAPAYAARVRHERGRGLSAAA